MGKSLNELIREQLEKVTSETSVEEYMTELRRLSEGGRGNSKGRRYTREEAHART